MKSGNFTIFRFFQNFREPSWLRWRLTVKFMKKPSITGTLLLLLALCSISVPTSLSAQTVPQTGLRGVVTDPSGARVAGATVQLRGPNVDQSKVTDTSGQYAFTPLAPGKYEVQVTAKGFSMAERPNVDFSGGALVLNFQLSIEGLTEGVTVQGNASSVGAVSIDPDSNASAIVLGEKELEALSDDPDELSQELQILAGPGAGPGGAQIYTDGFSNGTVPPKSAIREIRINSNPFSAEYDFPGFARIEILTKPGADTWHGQMSGQFNNQNFNSRSPLFAGSSLPPYKNLLYGGNVTGPLKKDRASFTFDFNRRDITENAFVLATDLDGSLNPLTVNQAILTPQSLTTFTPRLDLSINGSNTLIVRYQNTHSENDNQGVGGFSLASTAYNQKSTSQNLQVTESALLSSILLNETRFQFSRNTSSNISAASAPSLSVQGAFTGGSATIGNSSNITNRFELSNISILNYKTHTIKWGGRIRQSYNNDTSVNNFNGTFTFFGGSGEMLDANNQPIAGTSVELTALQVYQRTLLFQQMGLSPSQIQAAGGGASLFSLNAGTPLTRVTQFDMGLFYNDDWKIRPNFTLSYGLRYETQTNISDHRDWGPRLSIAWGLGGTAKTPAKTVLRAGSGLFYNRINDTTTLNAIRYNGVTQQSYQLTNPNFFPTIPSLSSLASGQQPQTIQLLAGNMQAPQNYGSNLGMDQQVNKYFRLSVNYFELRGLHQTRQRDVNAPLPGTGIYPYGDDTVRMITESSGVMRFHIFQVNPTLTYKKLTLFGFYGLFYAHDNNEGLPANPYNLDAESGSGYFRRSPSPDGGSSFPIWGKITVNPLFIYASAVPYTITTGLSDPDGTAQRFSDRLCSICLPRHAPVLR